MAALAATGVIVAWREGEILFAKGSPATSLHFLLSGGILLCYSNGRSLHIHQRGETVGWSSLHTPYVHTATAVCLADAATIQCPAMELYDLMRMDSEFGYHVMRGISRIRQHRKAYWSAPRI